MTASVASKTALSLELRRPRLGVWHLDCELDADEAISGPTVADVDGSQWNGTVIDSHVHAGRCQAWIVGGAGGMQVKLEPKQYVAAKLGDVIQDILTAGKEVLSSTVSGAILSRSVPQWERLQGPVSHALVRLLDAQGLVWRTLQDGTVWVGEDAWAEISPDASTLNEDWSTGIITIAPDVDFKGVASISPGSVYQGHRIEQVTHVITENSLRSKLSTSSASNELSRFLEPILRRIDYSTSWLCEVKSQNSDGTLQVSPLDKRIQGKGLNKVPIRTGLPGFEVKVEKGAVVSIEFDNGDPSQPYAALWKHNESHVTAVEFKPNGTGVAVCKVGDTVDIVFPMGLPITTALGPGIVTFSTAAKGIITGSGNSKFLV